MLVSSVQSDSLDQLFDQAGDISVDGDVITIRMRISRHLMAFCYKCVDGEWVRYKRVKLATLH